jgi:hypothetical protein
LAFKPEISQPTFILRANKFNGAIQKAEIVITIARGAVNIAWLCYIYLSLGKVQRFLKPCQRINRVRREDFMNFL